MGDAVPIETVHRYTVAMLRERPEALFVFGDNLCRRGRKGQAAVCRDEPNAVGLPTKRLPSMQAGAFFRDADFAEVKPVIDRECLKLVAHLRGGGTVVLPEDGIGTGYADLPRRAPRIHAYIGRVFERLREIAAEVEHPRPAAAARGEDTHSPWTASRGVG